MLPKTAALRCSLYADDVGIFATPDATELANLQRILLTFSDCSGLSVNMSKTEIFPIRVDTSLVEPLLQNFLGKISKFPGLPLHVRKLRRFEIQPLIDKKGARLPGWQGKLLSSAGRETIVKTASTPNRSTISLLSRLKNG